MKITTHHEIGSFANGRRIPDPEKAATEFEALLVAEVWKQSQRGPRFSTLLGDDSASRMGREMWIDELVGRAVAKRGLGLAEILERPAGIAGSAK